MVTFSELGGGGESRDLCKHFMNVCYQRVTSIQVETSSLRCTLI